MGKQNYQLFSVKDGTLHYLERPLTQKFIDETSKVLQSHVASTERHIYESILLCVASQFLTYERACTFVKQFKNDSLEQLKDPAHIRQRALEAKLRFKNDRHTPIITYVNKYSIKKFTDDFLAKPYEMRKELVTVDWIAHKTASFIYLCLGGTELMTLDVHNLRQIGRLDIEVDAAYFEGKRRQAGITKGKLVRKHPNADNYERIEQETLNLVERLKLGEKFPEFKTSSKPNGAFLTALFWWAGAKARRTRNPYQGQLFDTGPAFESPFS